MLSIRETLDRAWTSVARSPGFVVAPPTGEARRVAYERDGYVAGGPVFDEALLERLRDEFDRILAAGPSEDHQRITVGPRREFTRVLRLVRRSRLFEEAVCHPRLAVLLTELTGCPSHRMLLDQIQYKPPRIGGRNSWHRDMPSFPLARPYVGLTAWIPLDDATVRSGCLRFVPGSHRWGDASDVAVEGDGWGVSGVDRMREYRGHPIEIVREPVRAGHVHFHHEMVWHSSGRNASRHKRRALAVHYVGADDRYRPNRWTPLEGLREGDPLDRVAPIVVHAG